MGRGEKFAPSTAATGTELEPDFGGTLHPGQKIAMISRNMVTPFQAVTKLRIALNTFPASSVADFATPEFRVAVAESMQAEEVLLHPAN